MGTVKESVLELWNELSDECTWDDVMDQLYVRQKIETGIRDADAGRTTPHEEVFKEFEKCATA